MRTHTYTYLVIGAVSVSVAAADTVETCPSGPSFVQTAKKRLDRPDKSRVGESCYNDEQCFAEDKKQTSCIGATDTTMGRCELSSQVLMWCLWTQLGVTDLALKKMKCDKDGSCPRVRDPVKPVPGSEWFSKAPSSKQLMEAEEKGFMECERFTLKCTWTAEGVDMWNTQGPIECRDPEDCVGEGCLAQRIREARTDGEELFEDSGRYQRRKTLGCPDYGTEVTVKQVRSFSEDILKDSESWYRTRYNAMEEDWIQCVTPQQAYAAWATRPVDAHHVLCENLPYNCFTYEQAQLACRDWNKNPAVPGSGTGELCYKHELGETVGPSCRYMWTKDSIGKQGCYESNGNTVDNSTSDDDVCRADAGIVHCKTFEEVAVLNEDVYPSKVQFPLAKELQTGFDAACCNGHFPDPYFLYKNLPTPPPTPNPTPAPTPDPCSKARDAYPDRAWVDFALEQKLPCETVEDCCGYELEDEDMKDNWYCESIPGKGGQCNAE